MRDKVEEEEKSLMMAWKRRCIESLIPREERLGGGLDFEKNSDS
jgi:hypothetical protein